MKNMRSALNAMIGAGLMLGLLGMSGCSDQTVGDPSASKKDAESRRDAIQKPTQSGVPDKKAGGPGKGR